MIYRFRRSEEGFNGIGSIKTDICAAAGRDEFSFAPSSISRYVDYILAATTPFQTKAQVRPSFRIYFDFIFKVSTDPALMEAIAPDPTVGLVLLVNRI